MTDRREPDPWLRRLERTAVRCCLVATAVALAVPGGGREVAVAILAGGGLVGISYWAIKSSIDGLTRAAAASPGRPGMAWPLLKFAGRYALLAFLAYVMMARLRLHPIGLLVGASSVVAAATIEAIRVVLTPRAPRM